jgi:ribonuclease E
VYQDDSSDELSDVIDSLLVPSHDTDDELEHQFVGDDDEEDDDDDDNDDEDGDDVVEVDNSEESDDDVMDAD